VRVLGIDDFAFKRGHRYGTLLCDQERHQPVDVLPERSADAVAAWLLAHPGVEIITRDRATVYKEGATRGAPAAIQVVDRFHLLKNLAEALEEDFTALVSVLQDVSGLAAAARPAAPTQESAPPEAPTLVPAEAVHLGRVSAPKQTRDAAVHALREQGLSQHAIAAQVGMNRRTVRHYLEAAGGLRPRRGRCTYEPYLPYVLERWNAGCHNGTQVWREIRAQGYPGARSTLGPLFTQLRHLQGIPRRRRRPTPQSCPRLVVSQPVRVRDLVFAFLGQPDTLEPAQQHFVAELCAHHQGLATTYRLTQDFVRLLHERQGTALEAWVVEVTTSGLPHLRAFAAGLRQDWAAVQAGLTLSWSNGPTEGHVNRIKMIKRMMFGRAGFTLLRQRVLHRRT
jgi:transposase